MAHAAEGLQHRGPRRLPATRSISVIPFIAAFSVAVLVCFWFVELAKERNHGDPLFEFAYLRSVRIATAC